MFTSYHLFYLRRLLVVSYFYFETNTTYHLIKINFYFLFKLFDNKKNRVKKTIMI